MKQTTRIICITLCVLLIALSAAGVIWALYNKFASNEAHAEYEDFAGTDTLVNFNQLQTFTPRPSNIQGINVSVVDNWKIRFVGNYAVDYSAKWRLYYDYVSLTANHKYYFKIDSNWFSNLYLVNGDGDGVLYDIQGDFIYTDSTNLSVYVAFQLFEKKYYDLVCGVNIIDLTLMFGAGNEPTLEQAQEYFTAEYYSYNAGTPIPYGLDYLEGYQKGIQDFQNSLTATFNNDILGTLSFAANIAGFESSIGYDANLSRYLVNGLAGFRLGNSISSPINFKANLFIPNYDGGLYLAIFNYTDNGTLLPLWVGEVQDGSNLDTIDANFNIVNIDTLYFGLFSSKTQFTPETNTSAYFVNTELTIYNIDVAALVNSAIGQTKSSYMEGGAEYEAIYNKGYLKGLAEQNVTIGTMDYIGAAFSGIGSILAIELLPGVPFSLFILLPLMFGLIAFVVKLSKGGN